MQYDGLIAKSITFNYPQIFKIVYPNRIPWSLRLTFFSILRTDICDWHFHPVAHLTMVLCVFDVFFIIMCLCVFDNCWCFFIMFLISFDVFYYVFTYVSSTVFFFKRFMAYLKHFIVYLRPWALLDQFCYALRCILRFIM